MNTARIVILFLMFFSTGCLTLSFKSEDAIGSNNGSTAGLSSIDSSNSGEDVSSSPDNTGNDNGKDNEYLVDASSEANSSYQAHFTFPAVVELMVLFGSDSIQWEDPNMITILGEDLVDINPVVLAKLKLTFKIEDGQVNLIESSKEKLKELGLDQYNPKTGLDIHGNKMQIRVKGSKDKLVPNQFHTPYTQEDLNTLNMKHFQKGDVIQFLEIVLNANQNSNLNELLTAPGDTIKGQVARYLTNGNPKIKDLLFEHIKNVKLGLDDNKDEVIDTIEQIKELLARSSE